MADDPKKVILVILDGWGHGRKDSSNAIFRARTPFVDSLYHSYPNTELLTCSGHVGLPEGQMGNSEVGHLNIGAGRIVYQDLVKINRAIRKGDFSENPVLKKAFQAAKERKARLHFIGLVSDGGVHSHTGHLKALCDMAKSWQLPEVFIHCFTDGRDTDPKSALGYINDLENYLKESSGKIASVIGRYYAMDRDKRWERIKQAYDLLVHGQGRAFSSAAEGISFSYDQGITDEFIQPIVITGPGNKPLAAIADNDVVVCFNFRTDRCREITQVLTQQPFHEHNMHTLKLHYVTMTRYDNSFRNVEVVFEKDNLSNTLGEVLAAEGKKQLRIAETEKYPHVTFFFSGGREEEFENEKRILIQSPKVATYDLQPEMSALEVTNAVVNEIENSDFDFICLNFANPDMVGHTGDFNAVVRAVETVDGCLQQVVEAGWKSGYSFLITADHGNADFMVNADGSPNTAHSMNPVPVFLIDNRYSKLKPGVLADLAPTILRLMNIAKPGEMTGYLLIED